MERRISDDERRARLAQRHRLIPELRTDDVDVICDDLVALHGSDPATVFLSAGLRMEHPSIAGVEEALYEDRCLIRHHAMRRTIWVMTAEVARRAHASSTRKIAELERRKLLQLLDASPEIDDAEKWLEAALSAIEREIAQSGPITTRMLGRALPELTVKVMVAAGTKFGQPVSAHTRLLPLGAFEGRFVRTNNRGSWVSAEYSWALTADWVDVDLERLALEEASSLMVDHVLRRFGPCTETDLRWWTGWTARQVRRAIADCQARSVRLESGEDGWVADSDTEVVNTSDPWVALLPSLDPTTMGWKERAWYLDDDVAARVFDRNGNAGPTLWVDGRVVGGWVQRPNGDIAMEVQRDVGADSLTALEAEADRVAAMIGDTRFRVRFPSPNQKDLLADQARRTSTLPTE